MSKIFIWANSDLDGACSTILLGNIFPNVEYRSVFFGDFENQYSNWVEDNLENYDKVFVVGMVLDQSLINKLDDSKVVFISDRGESLNMFDSTLITEEYSSCCKLIYKKFKEKVAFTDNLKKLVVYIDDYNSYELKYKESEYLNGLYRKIRYNRFAEFVETHWDGYDGFNAFELKRVDEFFAEIDKEFAEIELYTGDFKGWSVLATFSKCSVNEIAKKMIDKYESDVIIVVNPDTKFVSFRKPVGSKADIQFMSENLCGGGGGEWASGGGMTQKFLDFTTKMISYETE
tara:strand:+ start:23961 stop:24824 length:864 start_codon:yes stop_codon:yes gene_type:complete